VGSKLRITLGAFHLVTQVDTNIILSFLTFNKKQRQNDTCVDLCHQMESTYCVFYWSIRLLPTFYGLSFCMCHGL